MLRAIWLLIVLAVSIAFAWYLRAIGGAIEMRVGDWFVSLPLWVMLVFLVVGFVVLHGLLRGWSALRSWPSRIRARRAARHRAEGDAAVTRTLLALSAGASDQARIEVRRARKLLGDTPHTLLLTAEAERQAGREEAANEAFRALAERDDARFLGLRGLLRSAMQREDWPEAQRLAREAEAAQPGAAWLREERARLALRTHDWSEALALKAPGLSEAALALAASETEGDEDRRAELERRAFQADPGFTPAALAHARQLRASGNERRARTVLQEAWKAAPHPEIAMTYLEGVRDVLERVKGAETLVQSQRTHPESRLLLGREATGALLVGRARAELEELVASGEADRRAFLALVDLERTEQGDTPAGRAAEAKWLRAATAAPPEPHWQCGQCGTVHLNWAPVCGHCGTTGRIAWTGRQGGSQAVFVAEKV
ncbi:heme biosynthesis HemY N-terminal domain-containing protein [Roseomonas elaeocarpi]|uniref:Heme biosynthesis HemY N-terminal domain-containing protein n=1 Tax=Roseomonas elaeocarpi TaxID=907779 RepID=A0ABV6JTC8_9PROT